MVVDGPNQLKKILPLREKHKIKAIIQYGGEISDTHGGIVMSVRVIISIFPGIINFFHFSGPSL